MSTSTKLLFIIAFLLLIYGYLCRMLNIYFFWDSKHFGWIMLATGLMGFLIDLKKILAAQKKSALLPNVFIGILIVVFGVAGGGIFLLKSSKAYQETINGIKTDEVLKSELGTIKGIGLFPTGINYLNFAYHVKSGPQTFIITVRGSRVTRDMEITLSSDWISNTNN